MIYSLIDVGQWDTRHRFGHHDREPCMTQYRLRYSRIPYEYSGWYRCKGAIAENWCYGENPCDFIRLARWGA